MFCLKQILLRGCGAIFGLPLRGNWKETVSLWFHRASSSSQVGIIVGLLPSFLWRRICVARMEGRLEPFNLVWQSIVHEIRSICQDVHKVSKCSRHDSQILQSLLISPLVPRR
jgi:hypothetical protein